MTDSYALYKMAISLKKDTIDLINSGRARNCRPDMTIQLYNDIRNNLLTLFNKSDIVKNIPAIQRDAFSYFNVADQQAEFYNVVSATGQIISFLSAVLGDPDKKIEKLEMKIKDLEIVNVKLEEVNRITSESLNRYIKSEEFEITEEMWNKVPTDISPILHDAFRAYGAGSYTACVCVCRNIIQRLVQQQCAKEDIKENGLTKQIDSLISENKIKKKYHQTLLNTVAALGHRSAHPTTEDFTKEKASLVLNGLLIFFRDDVFR